MLRLPIACYCLLLLPLVRFVLHLLQFVAAREELFFMLCAATISLWDRWFACQRRLQPALWFRPCCSVLHSAQFVADPRRFCGAGPLARVRPPGRSARTQEEPDQGVRRGQGRPPHVFGCGYAAIRGRRSCVAGQSERVALDRFGHPL
jgi:hypothetical protein